MIFKAPRLPVLLLTILAPVSAQERGQPEGFSHPYSMDYGPYIGGTWKAPWPAENYALKGLAIRVPGEEPAHVIFDTELLRVSAASMEHVQALRGTPYDGAHGPSPEMAGHQFLGTPVGPGWGDDGDFADPREIPHGPLPRAWGRYKGLFAHGDRVVVSYTVGACDVLESYTVEGSGAVRALARILDLGVSAVEMDMIVAERRGVEPTIDPRGFVVLPYEFTSPEDIAAAQAAARAARAAERRGREGGRGRRGRGGARRDGGPRRQPTNQPPAVLQTGSRLMAVAMVGAPRGAAWDLTAAPQLRLKLPPRTTREQIKLVFWDGPAEGLDDFADQLVGLEPAQSLESLTEGGPARLGEALETQGELGTGDEAYLVDRLTIPGNAEADSYLRFAAFDFFSDGRAALSTWNGDVWILSGIDEEFRELKWKRFATGLFDPLGLKIVDDVIHTLGRDQISRLWDLNGDDEADFYECFNNDVFVTKSFHEFAFDLQTDAEGNFYFSKAGPVRNGGRGFDKIVPHHGCVLKVAKDGSRLEVFATGLRAPNGIGVGPNGEVTSGDNEGTWVPTCRLNWMQQGTFNGCVDLSHQTPLPTMYDLPLCFLPMSIDNSGGGQAWVTTDKWGPFEGDLLHLSYGKSSLFKVLKEEVDGVVQGGVTRFPLDFTSSCMRARFHPTTGQLFVVGLKGWQTNASRLTGFDRVRYTGAPVRMATGIRSTNEGVYLTFTCDLDPVSAEDPESFEIEIWNYYWTETYGSPEVSTINPDPDAQPGEKAHDSLAVVKAELQPDGKTVFLSIPQIKPVMQMQIKFDFKAADGGEIRSEVFNSIHKLPGK